MLARAHGVSLEPLLTQTFVAGLKASRTAAADAAPARSVMFGMDAGGGYGVKAHSTGRHGVQARAMEAVGTAGALGM